MPEHHRAFGSLFFLLHQGKLLWLLNAPVIGRWFRWCMRIRRWDIGSHETISSIGPNFFTVPLDFDPHRGLKFRTDFRAHAKFSKRLYYAFRPLWWTLHAWDWCVADRWVPELSFGFSTLTAYPDADPETNTVDGRVVQSGTNVTWATLYGGAGDGGEDTLSGPNTHVGWGCGTTTDRYSYIDRSIYLFYTAALTAAAAISSSVLSIYSSNTGWMNSESPVPNIDIYSSAPASNTALVAGDYDSLGSTSFSGPMTHTTFNASSGYKDFTLNGSGISNIDKTGVSKYGTQNANYDVAHVAPAWVSNNTVGFLAYYADYTGTANDPKLVVTYTKPESYIIITKNWALE